MAAIGSSIPDITATEIEEIRAGGVLVAANIVGLPGNMHGPESPFGALLLLVTGSVDDAGAVTPSDLAAITSPA